MTTSIPKNIFSTKPWLFIVILFAMLIAFWSTIVTIAFKNLPDDVPVQANSPDAHD